MYFAVTHTRTNGQSDRGAVRQKYRTVRQHVVRTYEMIEATTHGVKTSSIYDANENHCNATIADICINYLHRNPYC